MNNILVFFYFSAIIAVASATDYCSSSICSKGVKHIACDNNGKFDASCSADAKMVTITDSLKKLLVDAHNVKRNFIARGGDSKHSPACRMSTMQWDDELAAVAAFNVKQCKMAHDKCRNTDAFKYSGQNLAWMGYYGIPNDAQKLTQAVDMWYSEVKDSKQTYIDSYPNGYSGPAIGHFTVMMADRNIRVGCAASTYSPAGQPYKAYLVACNYATTNMINFPIYASCKKAGQSCTTGSNPNYPNLCSLSEQYTVNKWF
ncbi:antigen 5 like allergen Cul n 1-like [Lucilia cuprina]|uniref:antigen 5 like allergen Cul n 1-like n=1 Tax=Lucilia cuprina TaxID=7375 RepID=UPI001F0577A5|nr:antigen 5 like allergen Cul n 1-like [Lucilia cuprina]